MINRDYIIQYTPCSQGSVWGILPLGQYFLLHFLGPVSGTNPRAENIYNAPAMMQLGTIYTYTKFKQYKQNRAGIFHPSAFGKSLSPRGCIPQYIPPLGSVRILYPFGKSTIHMLTHYLIIVTCGIPLSVPLLFVPHSQAGLARQD